MASSLFGSRTSVSSVSTDSLSLDYGHDLLTEQLNDSTDHHLTSAHSRDFTDDLEDIATSVSPNSGPSLISELGRAGGGLITRQADQSNPSAQCSSSAENGSTNRVGRLAFAGFRLKLTFARVGPKSTST